MNEYNQEEQIKEAILYKRIVNWTYDTLTLEDGTTLEIETFDADCCASGRGFWTNIKLDAVITDIELTDIKTIFDDDDYDTDITTAEIKIYHNQNIVAQNEMETNAGNGGYYYSVTGLLVTLPNKEEYKGFAIEA